MTTQTTITKPKIILKNGKPSEVILKWEDFKELLEKMEDIYDLSEIKRIKKRKLNFRNFDILLSNYAL